MFIISLRKMNQIAIPYYEPFVLPTACFFLAFVRQNRLRMHVLQALIARVSQRNNLFLNTFRRFFALVFFSSFYSKLSLYFLLLEGKYDI